MSYNQDTRINYLEKRLEKIEHLTYPLNKSQVSMDFLLMRQEFQKKMNLLFDEHLFAQEKMKQIQFEMESLIKKFDVRISALFEEANQLRTTEPPQDYIFNLKDDFFSTQSKKDQISEQQQLLEDLSGLNSPQETKKNEHQSLFKANLNDLHEVHQEKHMDTVNQELEDEIEAVLKEKEEEKKRLENEREKREKEERQRLEKQREDEETERENLIKEEQGRRDREERQRQEREREDEERERERLRREEKERRDREERERQEKQREDEEKQRGDEEREREKGKRKIELIDDGLKFLQEDSTVKQPLLPPLKSDSNEFDDLLEGIDIDNSQNGLNNNHNYNIYKNNNVTWLYNNNNDNNNNNIINDINNNSRTQPPKTQAKPEVKNPLEEELEELANMGFVDRKKNLALLNKYQNFSRVERLQQIVDELF